MKNPTIPNDRDTKENWERLARMAIAAMELGIRIEQDSGHRWIFTDKTADHYQPEIDPDVNEKLRAKQYGSFMDALENINTCLLQASFPSLIEMSENIDYDYDLTTFLGSPDMDKYGNRTAKA